MSRYIQSTLAKNPSFFEETISLLERSFNYPKHHSFLTDFYPLISPSNHDDCHIIIDEEKVIAHVAIKKRKISFKGQSLDVGFIGGIAVDSKYRGQGVFSTFFKDILSKYNEELALMFLWSDQSSLYEKFFFYECGGMIQTGKKVLLEESLPPQWKKSNLKDIPLPLFKSLSVLYEKEQGFKVTRTKNDWSLIREISSTKIFYKNDGNNILEYFLLGKGHDLEGIIHEHYFSNTEKSLNQLDIYKLWLSEDFNKIYRKKEILYGYFIKIANVKKLDIFLTKISNSRINLISKDEKSIQFKFDEKEYSLSLKEFTNSLFGPNQIKEFSEILPSLFINGVDSI
ncbi:GNAT family N-acetyltransferase [Halobacteriovorax sp. HLS]|uniref:GNAT family N-acetyltransferase n=1 Tax=Halobacteriovorax sp. HLS TaxID=2234000 RepID=UPI000FDB4092|nr:GNAT family N-acetyltransferase [Halobacteriovorax sp. HLS]